MRILLIYIAAILFASTSLAESTTKTPYYATIKADEANIRTGPSVRYPIQWVYTKPNWPIQVLATFERWRKIKDINGEIGWAHESLLSGRRNVILNTEGVQEIFRLPIPSSTIVLIAEKGVVAELISCKSNWCKIEHSGKKGWIESKHLWGVDKDEVVK